MTPLTETSAAQHLAAHALTPAAPGFVGLAVDLLLSRPGLPAPLTDSLRERPPLRHGHLTARSARVLVVSGPPSPGADISATRMTEDLAMPGPLIAGHGATVLDVAADPGAPLGAGVRVALEAGTADDGPSGMRWRWVLAQAVAPVLAAAFANSPGADGWRSSRLALRTRLTAPALGGLAAGGSGVGGPADLGREIGGPGADWARQVLDAPVAPGGPSLRQRLRAGDRLTAADLHRHARAFRPPVAARGHLVIDVADRQPGDGWRVPLAVISTLLDDASASGEALAATSALDRTGPAAGAELWERAARDGLSDPALAAAARVCFLAAYGALSRRGADRATRDAVAVFLERYVLRGRCPADDRLDRTTARP